MNEKNATTVDSRFNSAFDDDFVDRRGRKSRR